jgi:hypothetical protein
MIGFEQTGEIENFLIISMKLLQMKNYKLISLGFSILGKALNFWKIETVIHKIKETTNGFIPHIF